jgi:hypothetical protein
VINTPSRKLISIAFLLLNIADIQNLYDRANRNETTVKFDVEAVESGLRRLKNSNALDMDHLGKKKHSVEAHPSVVYAITC